MAALGAAFGLLALVVASVGIYGLLAYSVVTRTREMGIRVALGARRRQVVAHVIGGAARLVLFGVTAGVLIAWATSRLVESMLFEVKPTNPAAIAGAVGAAARGGTAGGVAPSRPCRPYGPPRGAAPRVKRRLETGYWILDTGY